MSRYYYDCPIRALYMLKEFGVKSQFKDITGKYLKLNADIAARLTIVKQKVMIHVDKGSESIFQPQANDLVLQENNQFQKIQPNATRDKFLRITNIIMRNEKHFFMPKINRNQHETAN